MYGVDWSIDIDGRDPNGNFPDSGDDRDSYYSSVADEPTITASHYTYRAPKYAFNSLEELATSNVFQTALTQALAHKDKQIRELQEELADLYYQQPMNDWMSP